MDLNDVIKDVISRVNSTLSIYEAEWISCKRTPTSEREVCKSFEQFISHVVLVHGYWANGTFLVNGDPLLIVVTKQNVFVIGYR